MPGDDRDHTYDLDGRGRQPNLDHPWRYGPPLPYPRKRNEDGVGDKELSREQPKQPVAVPLPKAMLLLSEKLAKLQILSAFPLLQFRQVIGHGTDVFRVVS